MAASAQMNSTPVKFDLFDHTQAFRVGRLNVNPDAKISAGRLTIQAPAHRGASVSLRPDGTKWDLSAWTRVEFDVVNRGAQTVRLRARLDNEGASDWGRSALNTGFVAPGQRKIFNVFLYRDHTLRQKYPELAQFEGMSGLPGGFMSHWHIIDAADVRSLQIELTGAPVAQQLDVLSIRATHPMIAPIVREKGAAFFPFVDEFGQYKHASWPGKVESHAQLKTNAQREADDLRLNPGSSQWNKYGGWQSGPQLRASGHFRTEKVDGKWWLVDPEGRLFWSHGANSVGTDSAGTRINGREKFYQVVAPRTENDLWFQAKPDAPAYFSFLQWNMKRQYGPRWAELNRDLTHRRLRSWGLNTIGNWSSDDVQSLNRTPFTASLWPWSPTISGDSFWDVFHPDFVKNFDQGIAGGVKANANNPWCIGYFIHNEMGWPGGALGTVSQIMASDSHSKRELVRFLRERTPDIADFNRKIGRTFVDWNAVDANRETINFERVDAALKTDAEAFYSLFAERYFQTCAEAMRKHAPNLLYLGSRMHVSNPLSVRAAAKWCDVLSFNLYHDDISGFRPGDADKPMIASEFHFGALDRGMFGTGLRPASDQSDRAAKYRFYVEGAARNLYVVGTHWFAYCPQSLTGRGGDGENYEDGFFDITNNPYPELRGALREVGGSLYSIRSGK